MNSPDDYHPMIDGPAEPVAVEMGRPHRVQLKRKAGWKMPPNTRSVARPGRFGNPFYVADTPKPKKPVEEPIRDGNWDIFTDPMWCQTAAEAVEKFEEHVLHDKRLREIIRTELRGFNLACFCSLNDPCHADTLLRIANE